MKQLQSRWVPLAMATTLIVGTISGTVAMAQVGAQPAPVRGQPISDEEFQSTIVDRTLNLTTPRGIKVRLRLEKDGRSVASHGFNDVGTWRPMGPGAYCARWHKLPAEERCATLVRNASQLGLLQADGQYLTVDAVD